MKHGEPNCLPPGKDHLASPQEHSPTATFSVTPTFFAVLHKDIYFVDSCSIHYVITTTFPTADQRVAVRAMILGKVNMCKKPGLLLSLWD